MSGAGVGGRVLRRLRLASPAIAARPCPQHCLASPSSSPRCAWWWAASGPSSPVRWVGASPRRCVSVSAGAGTVLKMGGAVVEAADVEASVAALQAPSDGHAVGQAVGVELDSRHQIEFRRSEDGVVMRLNGVWDEPLAPDAHVVIGQRRVVVGDEQVLWPAKKAGEVEEHQQLAWQIMMEVKRGLYSRAVKSFDKAVANDIFLSPDILNALLFICAGHADWEETARAAEHTDELVERFQTAQRVVEVMRKRGIPLTETALTTYARLACLRGDAEKADEVVQMCVAQKLATKHRTFAPALLAWAVRRDHKRALAVEESLRGIGLTCTPYEFMLLLEACSNAPLEVMEGMFDRMGELEGALPEGVVPLLRAYFASPAAQGALSPGHEWSLVETTVGDDGVCANCNHKLAQFPPTPEELELAATQIAQFAEQDYARDFARFVRFVDKHGPYGVFIDGANVALWGQTARAGQFSFPLMFVMIDAMAHIYPSERRLVVLHHSRMNDPGVREKYTAQRLNEMRANKELFIAQGNDDWYWLYGAIRRGAMLVSNDQMGDHVQALMHSPTLHKFRRDRQINFEFRLDMRPVIHLPPVYTTCTQRLGNRQWMFPVADGRWLCVAEKPAS